MEKVLKKENIYLEWFISFFLTEKGDGVINDSSKYNFFIIKIILQLPWQLNFESLLCDSHGPVPEVMYRARPLLT